MKYRAYESYVDSRLQWMGDIPSHWKVIQSRRLFSQRKERARPEDEQLTASQKYGVIYQKLYMEIENQRVVQVITGSDILKHVEANDFVISMRSFQGGLEWCKYPGSVSSAYVGLIPVKNVVPEFFAYLFKCAPYIQALQSTSNLVRDGQALRFENFSQVDLPHIPEDEQRTIASFLDHETAKIDTLIEKQQQLIKLLKEKRQAVISHAVTKGLNPNVPMRDSGVEWLGEIPAHWIVSPIKYWLSSLDSRRIPLSGEERGSRSGEYRYYGASGVIDYVDDYIFDEPTVLVGEDGANLVNRSTPLAFAVRGKYWVNNHAHILKPDDELVEYWAEAIEHIDINPIVSGSAQPKLTAENLNNLKIAFPPSFEERQALGDHILVEKSKFQALIQKAEWQIKLLQERRTALISAAVTGKIDVRDWQAPSQTINQKIAA